MVRTSPPRPVDVTALFPELAPLARTAVRPHPRPGAPTVVDSSIGGPLLWCAFDHDEDYLPRTVLRWRTAADITDPLEAPPEPAAIGHDDCPPQPCVLDPETVTEYPAPRELPEDLRKTSATSRSRR